MKRHGRALSALQHKFNLHECATPGSIFKTIHITGWSNMRDFKRLSVLLILALTGVGTAAAYGQPIFDRMKEDAERRAEHKAQMDAENPPATKTADNSPAQVTPAAPADPAAPAAPSAPAPAAATVSAPPAPTPAQ